MKPREYVYWLTLSLLIAPGALGDPEVRPISESLEAMPNDSVWFVAIDTSPSKPETGTLTAPDGQTLRFEATSPNILEIRLDGVLISGDADITGSIVDAPLDGTWAIYYPAPSGPNVLPGRQLTSLQDSGGSIYWQTRSNYVPEFWNGHLGNFTDDAPFRGNEANPNEAGESPEYFRFYLDDLAVPSVPDSNPRGFTSDSTVTCPGDLDVRGAWAKGLTQSENTFGRFWFIDGFQPASTDLSLLPVASSSTITDLGAGANGTHNATGFYNGVAGTSYQFEVRNGTTGDWQKGLTLFAPPLQCTEVDLPDLSSLEHDEGALQIQTTDGACKDQRIVLNVMLDKPLLGGEMFDVFIANASSGLVLAQFSNSNFNVDPGDVNWFNSFAFPTGEYVAIVLADLQGTPAYDHFDSYPVSVSPEACVLTFSDQSLELTVELLQQIIADSNATAEGALLVNSMDFATIGFDGFLLLLLFAAFMAWSLWNNWIVPGLMGLIGALGLFYESFPISSVAAIFLCLLSLWLQWWMVQRLEKKQKVL